MENIFDDYMKAFAYAKKIEQAEEKAFEVKSVEGGKYKVTEKVNPNVKNNALHLQARKKKKCSHLESGRPIIQRLVDENYINKELLMEDLSVNEYVVHSRKHEWGIGKITKINEEIIEVDFPKYKKASFKRAVLGDMIRRVEKEKGIEFWKKNRREEYCRQLLIEKKEAQRKKISELLKNASNEEKYYYRNCHVGTFLRHEERVGVVAITRFQDGTIVPKVIAIFLNEPRYKKITEISEIIPRSDPGSKSIDEMKLTHISFMLKIGAKNIFGYSYRVADSREIRITHCYNCRAGLDNRVHLECSGCKWIICPNCGACGHGFVRF